MDKIKIFHNDDESLKLLGELLSNESSRKIIRLLIEKEMYANEIAAKLEMRPNLVLHHLKKLEDLGVLMITFNKITKKGKDHRFFKMNSSFFVLPNHSKKEVNDKGFLKSFFKDGIKFAVIGLVSFVSWFLVPNKNNNAQVLSDNNSPDLTIPFLVIIIGLILFIIKKKRE